MAAAPPASGKALRELLASRSIEHVVVLGANGTMGYGSGALFTTAVPKVTFLARSKQKADEGLDAAIKQVRSATVGSRVETGDYGRDFDKAVGSADLVFEALTEDFDIKNEMFERIDAARRDDSIVATVTSGLSINQLASGRSDSFRKNFLGLHFFNPPNVIVGTELIAGDDTDPAVSNFVDAFSRVRLGREMIRTADTPGFAGNRVGFKVLNEAAQLAEKHGPLYVDRVIGPYTGRAMTPLATIDLVGWDIHRAIVDNIHQQAPDEAQATLKLPDYMASLMDKGTLGNKTGGGFFKRQGKGQPRLVLDPASGEYLPENRIDVPTLGYVDEVSALYAEGRYEEGMRVFLDAEGDAAEMARKVVAGYISYAFHRVGDVTETITGIDMIMGAGFNWAPPSVLVDVMGAESAVLMIDAAGVPVPQALKDAARSGEPRRFFRQPNVNIGKFFVAG